jgi:hypothetical protein
MLENTYEPLGLGALTTPIENCDQKRLTDAIESSATVLELLERLGSKLLPEREHLRERLGKFLIPHAQSQVQDFQSLTKESEHTFCHHDELIQQLGLLASIVHLPKESKPHVVSSFSNENMKQDKVKE